MFPLLNLPSLPGLIGEMTRQEMPRPTFIQAGLNGQSGDVAARNVASFAGPAAGAFYDGALIVASQPTGSSRRSGSEIPSFDSMCNSEHRVRQADRSARHSPLPPTCTGPWLRPVP